MLSVAFLLMTYSDYPRSVILILNYINNINMLSFVFLLMDNNIDDYPLIGMLPKTHQYYWFRTKHLQCFRFIPLSDILWPPCFHYRLFVTLILNYFIFISWILIKKIIYCIKNSHTRIQKIYRKRCYCISSELTLHFKSHNDIFQQIIQIYIKFFLIFQKYIKIERDLLWF